MKKLLIPIILITTMSLNKVNGQDSLKIINNLKGYHQLSDEGDIQILKSNVFDYFDLEIILI